MYWQIGDSGSDAALAFYRDLLRGIADGDPQITGLFEMPGLDRAARLRPGQPGRRPRAGAR